jgi:AcrR family transcriptional regulator
VEAVGKQSAPGLRRDAQRNYARLVSAGREVFSEKGVEGSLEEVARRAGVGIGTLYRHFPTREALAEAVLLERIEQVVRITNDALAHEDAWLGLYRFVCEAAALQTSDRGLRDVFAAYSGGPKLTRKRKILAAAVEQLVSRAHDEGSLRTDVVASDVMSIFWAVGGISDATADIAPSHWRRHVALLFDGLATSKPTPLEQPPLTLGQVRKIRSKRARDRQATRGTRP